MSIYKGSNLISGRDGRQGPRGFKGNDALVLKQVLTLTETPLDSDYSVPKSAFSYPLNVVESVTFLGFGQQADGQTYAFTGAVKSVEADSCTVRVLALTRGLTGNKGDKGDNGIGALSKGLFQLVVDDEGNLFAEYIDIDSGEAPEFDYDAETGDLYYIIGG